MLTLKLQYDYETDNQIYVVKIVQQDESLRRPEQERDPRTWRLMNNNEIVSASCPDVVFYNQQTVLFLRGPDTSADDRVFFVKPQNMSKLCTIVAEFNKRKNVVEINSRGSGFIV